MSSNTFNSIILIHPLNLLKLKVPVIGTGDNEILRLPDGNLLSSRQEWSRGRIAQVGGEGSGPRMQGYGDVRIVLAHLLQVSVRAPLWSLTEPPDHTPGILL